MAPVSSAPTATAPAQRSRAPMAVTLIVALVLLGLIAVAIRSLLEQRLQGNEGNAISSIRTLNTALYQHRQKSGDSYPKSTTELRDDNLDSILSCGQSTCLKSGYAFTYELRPATAMGPHYVIVARPNKFGNTGRRSFYSDESGIIRATSDNRPATVDDEPTS